MPPIVAQMAEAYVASHSSEGVPKDGRIRHYASSFLDGYTSPGTTMTSTMRMSSDAFAAGQAYRGAHPDGVADFMKGYGYVPYEGRGTWVTGFEATFFRPDGEKERGWWMMPMSRDGIEAVPVSDGRGGSSVRVDVVGFVGSGGGYGHLNMYPRQLFTLRVRRAPQ